MAGRRVYTDIDEIINVLFSSEMNNLIANNEETNDGQGE